MAEPQSKRFIQRIESARDRLYGLALVRGQSPGAAEGLLQRAVRQVFLAFDQGTLKDDASVAIAGELQKAAVVAEAGATGDSAMPADVWARLTAAVQIEAARSGAAAGPGMARVLNPESVLLLPDPLLAPKRPVVAEDPFEGLNLSPPSRFLVAAGIAILLGVLVTVFIVTRHPGTAAPSLPTTTRGAASAPAAVTAP